MKKPTVKYTNGEIGRVEIVEDFLPSPDSLVLREANVKVTLALQLPFCFEVSALSGSLVSSAPAGPCDDVCGLNTLSSEFDGNAADFLD